MYVSPLGCFLTFEFMFGFITEAIIVIANNSGLETNENGPKANEDIRAKEVRLILADGQNVGVVSIKEALRKLSYIYEKKTGNKRRRATRKGIWS